MIRKMLLPALVIAAFLLNNRIVYGQDTSVLPIVTNIDDLVDKPGGIRYLDTYQALLPSAEGAGYYDVLQRLDSAGLNWHLRRYTVPAKRLVLEQFFTGAVPQQVLEGPSREWYPDGQLREELLYHKNEVVGALRTYYPNGKPRRVQLISGARPRTTVCYDSVGNPLAKCPPYHTFAKLKGKDTYSGKFLKLVQQQYRQFLPVGYQVLQGQVVYYAFRIDPSGVIQEPRILSPVSPELQAAILQAIRQLPTFEPAFYEGQATDDVLDGYVQLK